jgi:hypothetical protein
MTGVETRAVRRAAVGQPHTPGAAAAPAAQQPQEQSQTPRLQARDLGACGTIATPGPPTSGPSCPA